MKNSSQLKSNRRKEVKIATNTKINLQGLNHFALNVKDMNRAEEFYNHKLGFPVIHRTRTKAGLQHIEVDAGNVAIALFESPELDLNAAHKTMTDDGYLHFAFGTTYDQFVTTMQALKENGIETDGEPRDWGSSVSVYFRDPDDHQLEINFAK
ncbi:MAG: VOC family protein [Nitrospinae bacterium]|nr:VOC family protein [Nitrospinota bacterium]MBL7021020.1 VOC family protein [Nitrospinaceae bacterium]